MADEITIRIQTEVDKAIKDMQKVQTEQKGIQKNSKSLTDGIKKNWVGIGAAIVGASAVIAKAFNFTKAFADFKQSSQAMSKQFGVDADKVIEKLKAVSAGTISNKDLVLSANKAMALGVTKDVGKMAELLEFARIRARSMGLDTTSAFNDIVTGIGRGSPLILDNLGIITKGWADEAKAAGVAYDAQFILNKVLEQSKAASEQAGGGALTLSERISKAGATMENIKVTIGESLAPVLSGVLGVFENLSTVFSALPASIKTVVSVLGLLIPVLIAINVAAGPVGILITGIVATAVLAVGKIGSLIVKTNELAAANKERADSEEGQLERQIKLLQRRRAQANIELNQAKTRLATEKEANKSAIEAANLIGSRNKRTIALTEALSKQSSIEAEINVLEKEKVDKTNEIISTTQKLNEVIDDKAKKLAAEAKAIKDAAELEEEQRNKALQDEIERITQLAQAEKEAKDLEIKNAEDAANAIEQAEIRKRAAMNLTLDITKSSMNQISQALQTKSVNDKIREEKALQETLSRIDTELSEEGLSAERIKVLEKQKVTAKEESDAKVAILSRKSWKQMKKARIISAQIDTAAAVIKALAEIPFPANVVAAIAYGALGTVNTGIIAAQQNPYATGGIVGLSGPEQALMGERGPETVLPAGLTALLLDAASNRGTVNNSESNTTNNNSFNVSANNPMELVNSIKRQNGLGAFMA